MATYCQRQTCVRAMELHVFIAHSFRLICLDIYMIYKQLFLVRWTSLWSCLILPYTVRFKSYGLRFTCTVLTTQKHTMCLVTCMLISFNIFVKTNQSAWRYLFPWTYCLVYIGSNGLRIISVFTVFHRNLSLGMCRPPKRSSCLLISYLPKDRVPLLPRHPVPISLRNRFHKVAAFYSA